MNITAASPGLAPQPEPRSHQSFPVCGAPGEFAGGAVGSRRLTHVFITINGEPHELMQPLTLAELLASLGIDPRRVAIEHNLEIIRRQALADATIREGDRIEIVNFVGGG